MQKIILGLLLLAGQGFGAIPTLTVPHHIDSAAIPKVIYIDQNFDSVLAKVNALIDTSNLYLGAGFTGTVVKSNTNLRLTVDADNNSTGSILAITHNGATDTLAAFADDSTFYLPKLTASLPVFTTAGHKLTTSAVTGTGSVMLAASPTTTGTLTAGKVSASDSVIGAVHKGTAGVFSSTMAIAGNTTVGAGTGAPAFIVNGAAANNRTLFFQTNGSNRWSIEAENTAEAGANAGTGFEIATYSDAGSFIDKPITIVRASGGMLTVARPSTFNNAITASDSILGTSERLTGNLTLGGLTASRTVETDANKILTSVAMTGTGNYVKSANPTLTGTLTAATISASGTVTADSVISSKFYDEGSITFTITGCATSPTATGFYTRIGKQVTIRVPALSAISIATGLTFTGVPAGLNPGTQQDFPIPSASDNGSSLGTADNIKVRVGTSGVLTFLHGAGWASANSKGTSASFSFTYTLQ